ncbi:MAG TPA: FAD-dependent oxidoreductase [Candidatus Nanopelagicales bacterium]|nr:FAD-dependent oxidoreductase [Candidatus Nanopelagicales bacterium]
MILRRRRPRDVVAVVVVGAGFSGLAAALRLVDAGLDVVVLEAADRVGGRTWTVDLEGEPVELGGMWTGPDQPLLAALLERYGRTTFPQPVDGRDLLVQGGLLVDDATQRWAEVSAYVDALDDLARGVPGDRPWQAADAERLDATTLDRWLEQRVEDPLVRRHLEVLLTELMCVPADELSLLTLLHAASTSGSLESALGTRGGAQEQRVVGGMHAVAVAMADELGGRVRLGTPLDRLSWNDDAAIVDLVGGTLLARDVVVAMAPSACEGLDVEPVLPLRRTFAQRRMPMGSVVKTVAVYDRPFWRDGGLSGAVLDLDGPFGHCVDASRPDGERGVLVSFLAGEQARALSDAALGPGASHVRRELWTDRATTWFGPRAADLRHYVDLDWSSVRYVAGGYSGAMAPGAWQEAGPGLVAPVGCLHWAGSETSGSWTGYVEGALIAGNRAAEEILAART